MRSRSYPNFQWKKKNQIELAKFLVLFLYSFTNTGAMSNLTHPKSIEQLLEETSIKTLISESPSRPIVSIPATATISEAINVSNNITIDFGINFW